MEQPPSDEYGPVRDRRDFEPLQLSLKRTLPCPCRELSFSIRGGCWRYSPSMTFSDRLGSIGEFSGTPSTTVVASKAWGDLSLSSSFHSGADYDECRTRKRLQGLNIGVVEHTKRPRIENDYLVDTDTRMTGKSVISDTLATVVSESTSSSSSIGKLEMASTVVNIVPKAALYSLYGKKKTQVANQQYLTWNNGARTHELRFSAIFVCPISCEFFLAGRYGSAYEEDGSIIWYNKKSLAEHAAAARAYDCFILRETKSATTRKIRQLGRDQPYHADYNAPLPKEIPSCIIAALESMRSSRRRSQPAKNVPVPIIAKPTTSNRKQSQNRC